MNKHQTFLNEAAESRIVELTGEVNSSRSSLVIRQLKRMQDISAYDSVKLIINSKGGDLHEALALCGALENIFVVPVEAVVIGECSSVATLILLSCSKRTCLPNARFGIHSGITSRQRFKDRMTSEHLQRLLMQTGLISGTLVATYERKLGMSTEAARSLIADGDACEEHMLSAHSAKRIGLVTQIEYKKINTYPAASKAAVL